MRYQVVWGVMSLCVATAALGMEDFSGDLAPSREAPQRPTPAQAPAASSSTAPLKWQDRPESQEKSGEGDGVTTINEARGNWLFKAKILRDARKLFNKIHKKVLAVEPLQEKYLNERIALDNQLDTFYQDYGRGEAEMEVVLAQVVEQLNKMEQTKSLLDSEEKKMLAEVKKRKEELEALKSDFLYIRKLENAISQALAVMSSQVTKANAYDEQAWDHYQKIEDTLSDEAAEELLNKIQVCSENVIAIENYLTGELRNFFTQSSEKLAGYLASARKKIDDLRSHGIMLDKKMRDLQAKEGVEKEIAEAGACAQRQKEQELDQRTWLSPIFDAISWLWKTVRDGVVRLYTTVVGWFGSKKTSPAVVPASTADTIKETVAGQQVPTMAPASDIEAARAALPVERPEAKEERAQQPPLALPVTIPAPPAPQKTAPQAPKPAQVQLPVEQLSPPSVSPSAPVVASQPPMGLPQMPPAAPTGPSVLPQGSAI